MSPSGDGWFGRPILRPAKEPPLPQIQHPAGHPPRVYYWIKQGFSRWENNGMSDIAAVRERFISVTPLQFDFTAYNALEELSTWELRFNGR